MTFKSNLSRFTVPVGGRLKCNWTVLQTSSKVEEMQGWYTQNHDNLTSEQESKYFEEVNELMFYLRTLEIRLSRHKDLSYSRWVYILKFTQKG